MSISFSEDIANQRYPKNSSQQIQLESTIRSDPKNAQAVIELAQYHIERNAFKQASRLFIHLTTLQPNEVNVWMYCCVASALANEMPYATNALEKITKLLPDNNLQMKDPRFLFCAAFVAEKKHSLNEAIEKYIQCLQSCNENSKQLIYTNLKGDALLRIVYIKSIELGPDQIMKMCREILCNTEFHTRVHISAYCLQGTLHEIQREFPKAEVVYRRALEIEMNSVPTKGNAQASIVLERLGRLYLRYHETIPTAVKYLFRAIQSNPTSSSSWYLLGRCYSMVSQHNDAFESYVRAVHLNPIDPQIWCSLGILYYTFGQYRESLIMFTKALKLDQTLCDAWYNVGALYDMCDQPEDAAQAYEKANKFGIAQRFSRAAMPNNNPIQCPNEF